MSSEHPPRIYFDTNEGAHDNGYWLILDQSKADLHGLGDRLREGERVVIYMPGELEMEARLRFEAKDAGWGPHWIADPVPGTVRHVA